MTGILAARPLPAAAGVRLLLAGGLCLFFGSCRSHRTPRRILAFGMLVPLIWRRTHPSWSRRRLLGRPPAVAGRRSLMPGNVA